jgi:hypothetical protein
MTLSKIITKEEKLRKISRNQLIVGIILIGILVFSTIGYALNFENSNESSEKLIDFNGIKFNKNQDYWTFNSQGLDFITKYNPKEIENITFNSFISISDYRNKPYYYVIDNDNNIALSEILRNIDKRITLRSQRACLNESNCSLDLPIKSCKNDNIIIIREPINNETEKIYQQDKCTFIISKPENQTKFSDAYLFRILNIK